MTAWRFTRTDRRKDGSAKVTHCTVAVEPGCTWYTAREHARGVLQMDHPLRGALPPNPPPLTHTEAPQAAAEWVLRWVGTDAGRVPARRLVAERVARRRT